MATNIAAASTEGYTLDVRARANVTALTHIDLGNPDNYKVLVESIEKNGLTVADFDKYLQNLQREVGNEVEYYKILTVTSNTLNTIGIGFSSIEYDPKISPVPLANVSNVVETEEVLVTPLNYADRMNLNSILAGNSEDTGKMHKVIPKDEPFREVEIKSHVRKPVETNPFLIKMLDKDYKNAGIYVDPGVVIWGMSLNPNPNSLSIGSSKIINRYQTMSRWVEEHWGDDVDTISFSGSTYSFFAYQNDFAPDVGLTTEYRNMTPAYKTLRNLANIFKYNGMIFQDEKLTGSISEGLTSSFENFNASNDSVFRETPFIDNDPFFRSRHPLQGLAKERLYINIYFDYVSFLGHFESFDIVEESERPYAMTYNVVFRSEKTKWHQGYRATDSI